MKRKIFIILLTLVLVLSFSLLPMMPALAATAPTLGTAASFAVLGGAAVTLTTSNVTGDVGLPSASVYTNTGSTIISGTLHQGGGTYASANSSFYSAYAAVAAMPVDVFMTSGNLSGNTVSPGVYGFVAGETETSAILTLDAGGNPNAVWIFKIGTGGTGSLTGTSFTVNIVGGSARNVFWWAADGVTVTDSDLKGTILAGTAIAITRGTSIARALAKGAVTIGPLATFSIPPAAPTPGGGPTVGGEAYPINKVSVLVPWLILALIIVIGGSVLVLRRRTSR